ncbi:MAG TPA: UvrD-helicase domain-containing protein [Terriglobales bacterium]|nr:UvrD-helicase domain-containing protein [Terriglobales bacterium]
MSGAATAGALEAEDRAARQAALEPSLSAIVEAPAGAGKTELLIQRYLRLLAVVEEPERILALTFTRKAAAEMRLRIAAALRSATAAEPAQEPARTRWRLAREALHRDRTRDWRLLENPARLRALTFDGFCRALVARTPWQSRLGSLPVEPEAADHVFPLAAQRLLETKAEDPVGAALRVVLDHLNNDWPRLEKLIGKMLGRRDQWMRHLFQAPDAVDEWRERLESSLAGAIRAALRRARAAIQANGASDDLAAAAGLGELPGIEPGELGAWQEIANLALTHNGDRRKRVPKDLPGAKEVWKRAVDALDDAACEALAHLCDLPPAHYDDAQWQVLARLIVLLQRAAADLKLAFRASATVDFIEVAQAARAALGDESEPSDLAYALDGQLEHILVDEFQDTSVAQYELLRRLIREWTPGEGRSIFLVGDPKQSIYRFREAEVALFLRVQEEGLDHWPLARLRLRRNFRSHPKLIGWMNLAGAAIFPSRADEAMRAVPFEASVAGTGAAGTGIVEMRLIAKRDDEGEAAAVVEIVQAARRRSPAAQIAVLVRARSHATAILAHLQAAAIPTRAVEMEPLEGRSVVRDLWALTRALAQPMDRVAWLALLRAPWCGCTLTDLLALAGSEADAPVWTSLQDAARLAGMASASRAAALRVAEVLKAAIGERERGSWRRAVEGAWVALGGPAGLADGGEFADAQAFLRLLDQLEAAGSRGDLDELASRLEELSAEPQPAAPTAVQVMTIHKAKGLEFDVVILPGLGRRARQDAKPLLRWDEVIEEGEAKLLLAPIAAPGQPDAIEQYLSKIERGREREDMKRLLYVALTRAKSELYLLGNVTEANATTLLGVLRPAIAAKAWAAAAAPVAAGAPLPAAAAAPMPAAAPHRFRRLAAGWQPPAPPPDVLPRRRSATVTASPDEIGFRWAGHPRRQIGVVVHACLCQMARTSGALPAEAAIRGALRQQGLGGTALADAAREVLRALSGAAADERGRWILADHAEGASEQELAGWTGEGYVHARVDRTFVADGTRWIIDYKTGVHEGGDLDAFLQSEQERYRPQLETYARLFRALDPRPARMALFFPLLRRADGRLIFLDWAAGAAAASPRTPRG